MPLFDWIRSDLHNLNLDWIISKIKTVEESEQGAVDAAADANASKTAAAASATAANNSKNAAAGSATLAAVSAQQAQNLVDQLDTTIAQDVSDWLENNLTPTSPPVDDTLTIQGAAADAKKTGDEISDLKTEINLIGDSNEEYTLASDSITGTTDYNGHYIATGITPVNGETYYLDIDSVSNCMSSVCASIRLRAGTTVYGQANLTVDDVTNGIAVPVTVESPAVDNVQLILYRNASSETTEAGTTTFSGVRITRKHADVVGIANKNFDLTENDDYKAIENDIDALNESTASIDSNIDAINNKIAGITDNDPPFKILDVDLQMGGYGSDGVFIEDNSGIRWCTVDYIYVADLADTVFTVPETFDMYVCLYTEGSDSDPVFDFRSTWTEETSHDVKDYYAIKWTIVKHAWIPMTEEEANCITVKEKMPWYNTLLSSADEIEKIPDYYKTQLDTVSENVRNDAMLAGQNGDTFAFITDVHWSGNYHHSPNLINYIKEHTDLNMIICGGDLIDRSLTSKASQITEMQKCMKAFKQIMLPMLTAVGNHERNSADVSDTSLYLTYSEMFAITQNPSNNMPLHYLSDNVCYYYDKTATNTRYIILDSGQNNIDTYDITTDQITWMQGVIESVPADYHIIVVVHSLGGYQSLTDPVGINNPFVYKSGASAMLSLLDTLKATYNIEAVFAGHVHYDANASTTGGIPIVWTNSDAKWQYYGMTQPSDGTVNAQCFDVVTLDYESKKIYLRRVGRGSDRTITY